MSEAIRTLRTYSTYEEARDSVDRLIEADLTPTAVSISARGIRLVERLHPRGWLAAAADGAVSGAMIGLLVGFLLGLFSLNAPGFSAFVLGFWGALIGSTAGLLTGLGIHAFRSESERAASERSLTARHFDVCVDTAETDRASRILAGARPGSRESAAA